MRQVTIIVKPFVAEAVLRAVEEFPLQGCTVCEAKGYSRQKGYLDKYMGSEYSHVFLPKVEITVWVHDDQLQPLSEAVVRAARTGRIGDGKVLIVETAWPEAIEF